VHAASATYQKGAILEARVKQAGAASNIIEDEGASSGGRICRLSEGPPQTSHCQGKYPRMGEAAIMMSADTKKDVHTVVGIHYNTAHHESMPRGGASDDCLPKLYRWPFSGSSCTQATGTAKHESMVGSHARRVKLFSAALRIFGAPQTASLVITVLPPASFLAPLPHTSHSPHRRHFGQGIFIVKSAAFGDWHWCCLLSLILLVLIGIYIGCFWETHPKGKIRA
jgi:hypothetical protein